MQIYNMARCFIRTIRVGALRIRWRGATSHVQIHKESMPYSLIKSYIGCALHIQYKARGVDPMQLMLYWEDVDIQCVYT